MQWGRAGLTQQGNNDLNILFWILHDKISNKKKFRPLKLFIKCLHAYFQTVPSSKILYEVFLRLYLLYNCCAVSHNFSLVHVTLSQSDQQAYLIIVIFRAQIPVHTHTLTFSRSKKVRFSNSNVVVTLTACIHVQVNMVISGLNHRCRTQILLLIRRIHNGLCLLT